MSRTQSASFENHRPGDTQALRNVDIVPVVEHVTYEDGGYEITFLAKGKHYDLHPDLCQPIETKENMKNNGFAIEADAIAVIKLADFPLILFDRGPGSEQSDVTKWEPIIDLPNNKDNILIGGRFFLLGQEGFIQIGLSAGAHTGRSELSSFVSFNAGEEVMLGRDYGEVLNSDMNHKVSEKHASIAVSADGQIVRIIDLSSTNGTQIETIPQSS